MHNKIFIFVLGTLLLMPSLAQGKRPPRPNLPPVVRAGIEYRIAYSKLEFFGAKKNNPVSQRMLSGWHMVTYLKAFDTKTKKNLWEKIVTMRPLDLELEEDVQWVFIKLFTMDAQERLILMDEEDRTFIFDIQTRQFLRDGPNRQIRGQNLNAMTGSIVTLDGQAENRKDGAVLLVQDTTVWIDGLRAWPQGYFVPGQKGIKVRARGMLTEDDHLPVISPEDRMTLQGYVVDDPGDARSRHRYVLKNARWELPSSVKDFGKGSILGEDRNGAVEYSYDIDEQGGQYALINDEVPYRRFVDFERWIDQQRIKSLTLVPNGKFKWNDSFVEERNRMIEIARKNQYVMNIKRMCVNDCPCEKGLTSTIYDDQDKDVVVRTSREQFRSGQEVVFTVSNSADYDKYFQVASIERWQAGQWQEVVWNAPCPCGDPCDYVGYVEPEKTITVMWDQSVFAENYVCAHAPAGRYRLFIPELYGYMDDDGCATYHATAVSNEFDILP
ncbi:MAG: hypothetical protein K8S27_00260 [Candidatus Omnitrophica bacterium]|nr:hypothetical protein [Candidatus Omnitrophota bacterium]